MEQEILTLSDFETTRQFTNGSRLTLNTKQVSAETWFNALDVKKATGDEFEGVLALMKCTLNPKSLADAKNGIAQKRRWLSTRDRLQKRLAEKKAN